MRTLALLVVVAAAVASVGCSSDRKRESEVAASAILFTKGASTDPYGSSRPNGFGIMIAPATARERIVQVTDRTLGWYNGATWLDADRIVVPRNGPPLRPPLIYRLNRGKLRRVGSAPVPRLELIPVWSPDQKLIATEPVVPCDKKQRVVWKCYRSSARILIRDANGSHPRQVATGHFDDWTPDGRLLVTNRNQTSSYEALDVDSGRRSRPISVRRVAAVVGRKAVTVGPARWSADGRYIAAMVRAPWRNNDTTHGAIVIARRTGRPVRLLRSPYIISMFAWSPRGHRLAYTTSGFPSPHELFIVETPSSQAVRLFATAPHFDWITWSPDADRLLLDDGVAGWKLFTVSGRAAARSLRRLGGRPRWCCPVNSYATKDW